MRTLRQDLQVKSTGVQPRQAPTIWTIESRYTTLQFISRLLQFFTVNGRFNDFSGVITLDENDIRRSSVEVTIQAASIDTGNKKRDSHLRSVDFLDVEQYPEIRFQSTKVERGRDRDLLRITGTLELKEVRHEIVLDVWETDRSRSPQGEEVAYYTAQVAVDRFAFGISYGRGLIGRSIRGVFPIQATRKHSSV